jgi:hypothetical protein
MTSANPPSDLTIRPFQYRDLDDIENLSTEQLSSQQSCSIEAGRQLQRIRRWYGLFKFLSIIPNPLQHVFSTYVADHGGKVYGMVQVSPFNRSRSTWRVERVFAKALQSASGNHLLSMDVGSQLLRHCFESIWEARTWLIEVNVNDSDALSLYRKNGFQPLAQMAYWAIAPHQLQHLAQREPDLPNLLPVSNADAFLLHQLDTVSMPPLMRQVFDRQTVDFKTSLLQSVVRNLQHWATHTESVSGYVFEPQRKAAIGYFNLRLCRDGSRPHEAELTVHPAYTWLYPELLVQMAQVTQGFPDQSLRLVSSDYQPEREEYLETIGAERIEHTLMMSRSVWHKLRESRPVSLEGLQLSDVLQGLQPARKPIPTRFMVWDGQPFSSSSPSTPLHYSSERVNRSLPALRWRKGLRVREEEELSNSTGDRPEEAEERLPLPLEDSHYPHSEN